MMATVLLVLVLMLLILVLVVACIDTAPNRTEGKYPPDVLNHSIASHRVVAVTN